VANRGNDSEAIISRVPFATKDLYPHYVHFPFPCPTFDGRTVKTLIHMQNATQHGRTAKDRFELVIRLQQSRGSQPSDAGLRLRAQALLKDILMSRLEVDAEINAHEYVHTQGFDDLGRALAASRALQLAFEGFRGVVPTARANVSVVLRLVYAGGDGVHPGRALGRTEGLARLCKAVSSADYTGVL